MSWRTAIQIEVDHIIISIPITESWVFIGTAELLIFVHYQLSMSCLWTEPLYIVRSHIAYWGSKANRVGFVRIKEEVVRNSFQPSANIWRTAKCRATKY